MSAFVEDFYDRLRYAGVVPMVSVDDAADAPSLAKAVFDGGLGALEIELDSDAALGAVHLIKATRPELLVGVGEVTTTDQVDAAAEVGADFVSCPSYDDGIARHCAEREMPLIATTVDEGGIFKSGKLGFTTTAIVPAFEENALPTIDRFATAFEGHLFMPRGGVDATNLTSYLVDPSVIACATDEWPVDPRLLEEGEFGQIQRQAAEASALVREARKQTA